ncbi:MAG: thiamine phosphate synthase [Chloroflexi bacterium]|nr:thiamine phosphate synthase [Chloroflexota bacterium]
MLVTDSRRLEGGVAKLPEVVQAALEGGITAVQLREPTVSSAELFVVGCRLRALTSQAGAALFVNDRLDVALAVGADGVQLGERSLPLRAVRPLAGSLLLGRSVHDTASAVAAERDQADFLLLGMIFASASHPDRLPAGPTLIQKARRDVRLPIVGIGGITAENATSVMSAGASGVAVIGAIQDSPSPRLAARKLVSAVEAAWADGAAPPPVVRSHA